MRMTTVRHVTAWACLALTGSVMAAAVIAQFGDNVATAQHWGLLAMTTALAGCIAHVCLTLAMVEANQRRMVDELRELINESRRQRAISEAAALCHQRRHTYVHTSGRPCPPCVTDTMPGGLLFAPDSISPIDVYSGNEGRQP